MKLKKIRILDCTLRDGGYYTNWDFDQELVTEYCMAMEDSPVEYVEIGYRSKHMNTYLGEYFYCPEYVLNRLKGLMPSKKLVLILNEKDSPASKAEELLASCKGKVTLIRIAVDPNNFERAIKLAKVVKNMDFEVAFNIMYMSNWNNDSDFLDQLDDLDGVVDFIYMVDSFGGVMPEDIKQTVNLVKSKTSIPLGFHGHNNLEMALSNTLTAVKEGCEIVDATITGMGRGAGNLRTELLLTYLDSIGVLRQRFSKLSATVSSFEKLKEKYKWGSSLPYIFSGAHSLPQKQVMEWVVMNRYPISSMLNALTNQKESVQDNARLNTLESTSIFKSAVIIGGGKSVKNHSTAIKKLIEKKESVCLIHAGARNVSTYLDVDKKQYYSLAGSESDKLLKQIGDFSRISQTCVYPPYPRRMGTSIPEGIKHLSRELKSMDFTSVSEDSPLAVSLQVALNLEVEEILLAGFDGYDTTLDQTQFALAKENQEILNDVLKISKLTVKSITDTKYKNIGIASVYSLI